jgi:hypothetical protein
MRDMRTLKTLCISLLLLVFAACARQGQNQQTSQLNAMTARFVSLEHDVQRVKSEVVRLESQHYIDSEIQSVLDPSSRDCQFAVSEWAQTQEVLNGFINDSAAMRRGFGANGPDPRIQSGIRRLIAVINGTCKSSLVFNAKVQ